MASTVWKGQLTFGLLSLPVKLHSAARRESVSFNMLRKSDKSRLKQVLVAQADGKSVPKSEIVKGYEFEKNKYVVVDDAELKKLESKQGRTVEVKEFVKAEDVNPIWLDESYYVAPGTVAGERVYALLYQALKTSQCFGVARMSMNSREYIVIFGAGESGVVMHTMFYNDELRQMEEFRTDTSAVKDDELAMALRLIQCMRGAFEPSKYRDEFRSSVLQLIACKIGSRAGSSAAHAAVVDITTALRKSLRRNDGKRVSGAQARRVNALEKPHRNAARGVSGASGGMRRGAGAIGAQARQQRALGDPLSRDGGRGLAPQRASKTTLGNPKRSLSGF